MSMTKEEIIQKLDAMDLGSGDSAVWFTNAYHVGNGFWVYAAVWAPINGKSVTALMWEPHEPTPQQMLALDQERLRKAKRALELTSKLHLFHVHDFYVVSTQGGL